MKQHIKKAPGNFADGPTQEKKRSFFFLKVPLIYIVLLLSMAVFFYYWNYRKESIIIAREDQTKVGDFEPAGFKLYKQDSLKFIQPLIYFENKNEAVELLAVKSEANLVVNTLINEGIITNASVYINRLSKDHWFCLNPEIRFSPASLIKIPVLMIFLKESEKNPAILEKKLTFSSKKESIPDQTFKSKKIEPGKAYTIRDLLVYMVVHSDINATYLLNQVLDINSFQDLFTSIGIEKPILDDRKYDLKIFDYSKFFHILYNSTYLSHANSNYALSLLAQCDFYDGIRNAVPSGVAVANKFGESIEPGNKAIRELHECGIIYFENDPVLITVFTKGKDVKRLPEAISRITKEIILKMKPEMARRD